MFSSESQSKFTFFGKFRGLLDDEEEPTGLDGETSDGFQSLSDDDDIDSDNDIDNDVDGDDDEFDEEGFGEDSEDEEVVFNKKPTPSSATGRAQQAKKGGETKSPKEKKKNKKKESMEDEMDFAEMEAAATKSKKKKFPKANTSCHHFNQCYEIIRFVSMHILIF
jgi:hypothetical protein